MPRVLTIGYGDADGYERTPETIRATAHEQEARRVADGAILGIAGSPVQVGNPEGSRVETIDGPFMSSALPIAGITVIKAATLEDAITKVSNVPSSMLHGIVEV